MQFAKLNVVQVEVVDSAEPAWPLNDKLFWFHPLQVAVGLITVTPAGMVPSIATLVQTTVPISSCPAGGATETSRPFSSILIGASSVPSVRPVQSAAT